MAQPELVHSADGFERWDERGALGYLTLAAIVDSVLAQPPRHARVVVAANCFPTGMLGYWVRRLADGGLAAALTATSPARLAHPDGGDPLVGTTPLAIAVPSSDGRPLVADVSMGKVTYGDVIAGHADAADLVLFGGEQAYKAFALAAGLQLPCRRSAWRRTARCSSSRGPRPIPSRRFARSPPGSGFRGTPERGQVLVLVGPLAQTWIELERTFEMLLRLVDMASPALDAGEVVVQRRMIR